MARRLAARSGVSCARPSSFRSRLTRHFNHTFPSRTSVLTRKFRPPTAKRAFLTLLSSPPPALQASETHTPKLSAYTGPDVAQILAAVQNRPRSRSMNGGHSRKGSLLGSGGAGVGTGAGGHHTRNGSYGRQSQSRGSFGQNEMRGMMDQGNGFEPPPPVPSIPDHLNGGDESSSREGAASPPGLGRPQLNDAAQRHVQAALGRNGGHAKTGAL